MSKNTKFFTMLIFLCLAATYTTYLTQARERESVPSRESFEKFPDELGAWHKANTQILDNRVLGLLAPDDYISRTYVNTQGQPIFLFIAYYLSQRSGKTLHSPQNCLPGAGWEIVQQDRLSLPDDPSAIINDFTIAKQDERLLTYYWYQGRGRVQASEYWDKIYGVQDAVFKNRTDAALVRVMIGTAGKSELDEKAKAAAMDFIKQIRAELPRFIPN